VAFPRGVLPKRCFDAVNVSDNAVFQVVTTSILNLYLPHNFLHPCDKKKQGSQFRNEKNKQHSKIKDMKRIKYKPIVDRYNSFRISPIRIGRIRQSISRQQ